MRIIVIIFFLLFGLDIYAQFSEDSILISLKLQFNLSKFDRPEEFVVFNKDTIIVAGYLEDLSDPTPRYDQKMNTIYKTTDGGRNWKVVRFNGDAWIYDTYHKSNGKIWMGGSDNYMHYSPDFGETWQRKNKPFKPENRVLSIFMVDSLYGIAGGLFYGLAITYDNWKSTIQLETPADQKEIQLVKGAVGSRIDDIAILDSLIVINQYNYIFYSKVESINWKKFSVPVVSFTIEESKKEIDLLSRNGKHFIVGSDLNLRRTYQSEMPLFFIPITEDSTILNLTPFFNSEIKTITISSIKYDPENPVHMRNAENPQIASVYFKEGGFVLESKEYGNQTFSLNQNDISAIFLPEIMPLNVLSKQLAFSEPDYQNFEEVLFKEKEKRKENEKWGGNNTAQLDLKHPLYKNPNILSSGINQKYVQQLFYQNQMSVRFGGEILVTLINENNEEILISTNSYYQGLPWELTYHGITVDTYNPKLTELIKTIIPQELPNYEMLLGGELIYWLITNQIIDELEYTNGY